MKTRVLDAAIFVQMQRDLGMAFNARHRIDDDSFLLHGYGSWLLASGSLVDLKGCGFSRAGQGKINAAFRR
jgi:hypothetical protein